MTQEMSLFNGLALTLHLLEKKNMDDEAPFAGLDIPDVK